MTKQINLVINDKVGVGKSFFATNFVPYLKIAASIIAPSTAKEWYPFAKFREDARALEA